MTESPPPSYAPPPPAAPAKRRFPIWILIVVGVLLLACIVCAVIAYPAIGGAMAGAQLPAKCVQVSGLDQTACATWAQTVVTTAEFQTCATQLQGNMTADSLYACLVEQGVGP